MLRVWIETTLIVFRKLSAVTRFEFAWIRKLAGEIKKIRKFLESVCDQFPRIPSSLLTFLSPRPRKSWPHKERTEILSFCSVNHIFWSQLGCSWRNATILAFKVSFGRLTGKKWFISDLIGIFLWSTKTWATPRLVFLMTFKFSWRSSFPGPSCLGLLSAGCRFGYRAIYFIVKLFFPFLSKFFQWIHNIQPLLMFFSVFICNI